MARAAVTITDISANAATAAATGNALNPTDGHVITCDDFPLNELVIEITHTTDASKVVTVKGGDNPPANATADLAVTFAAGDSTPVVKYLVLESARFLQSDGTVEIDVASGATGKIRAYKVPAA